MTCSHRTEESCHCAIFFTHFSSFLTPFPLHFSRLFHSIPSIFTSHCHTRFPSFLLPFLKTHNRSSRREGRHSIEGCQTRLLLVPNWWFKMSRYETFNLRVFLFQQGLNPAILLTRPAKTRPLLTRSLI